MDLLAIGGSEISLTFMTAVLAIAVAFMSGMVAGMVIAK